MSEEDEPAAARDGNPLLGISDSLVRRWIREAGEVGSSAESKVVRCPTCGSKALYKDDLMTLVKAVLKRSKPVSR